MRTNELVNLHKVVLAGLMIIACEDRTQCQTYRDCANSEESRNAGRCGPDFACIANACEARCVAPCSVAREDVNPCEDGRICTEVEPGSGGECTSRPIACDTAEHCPVYRPGPGAWSCVDGTCTFPGFAYRSQ